MTHITKFEDAFPGVHVTSWTNDEGFDLVTIGIPDAHASTLWTGEYDDVLTVWDALDGHTGPRPYDPLYVALDGYLEALQDEYARAYAESVDDQIARDNEAEHALRDAGLA